ncbi:MAG: hypothetical protein ABIK62_04905 [candidate division WOR-3 bacterium]
MNLAAAIAAVAFGQALLLFPGGGRDLITLLGFAFDPRRLLLLGVGALVTLLSLVGLTRVRRHEIS